MPLPTPLSLEIGIADGTYKKSGAKQTVNPILWKFSKENCSHGIHGRWAVGGCCSPMWSQIFGNSVNANNLYLLSDD